jgi:hypothetical protein
MPERGGGRWAGRVPSSGPDQMALTPNGLGRVVGRSPAECELDPERAVAHADVGPCLFRLALPASRAALARAFLSFLRVPVPAPRRASGAALCGRATFLAEEACCPPPPPAPPWPPLARPMASDAPGAAAAAAISAALFGDAAGGDGAWGDAGVRSAGARAAGLARALPGRAVLGGYGAPAGRRAEPGGTADFLLADADSAGARARFATCAAAQVRLRCRAPGRPSGPRMEAERAAYRETVYTGPATNPAE